MKDKINKSLPRCTRIREKAQISKIANEREDTTTDITEIQRIIRNYYEKSYANVFDKVEGMDKFLETHNLPSLIHEEI